MCPGVATWLDWLQCYNGAVIAVATVTNVIVAGLYAYFTWGLWTAAVGQADITSSQASAAREQTDLTRRMFEAAHRPYLGIESSHQPDGQGPTMVHRFTFQLYNHGSVPAVLTGWRASITRGDTVVLPRSGLVGNAAVVVQPGWTSYTVPALEMGVLDTDLFPPGTSEGVTWEAVATYQGVAERTYNTRVRYSLIFAGLGGGYRARHDETVIYESE